MKNLSVSEISITAVRPSGSLIAFCSCVLNDSFYLGNLALHSKFGGGYRLVYPTKLLPSGKEVACFCPIKKEAGLAIEESISDEVEKIFLKIKNKKSGEKP